ncbi:MAG: thioredoxin family protein [Ignavibacteriales bacterium]|nr:thioredoxin family protein [Ignavibacteriales bacterium]
MLKKPLTVIVTVVAMAVFAAFSGVPEVEIGKPVPEFSLKGIDGKTYSLADFKGRVVVLEWTNPNCPFVQRVYEQGVMTTVQKKYADNVVWLTVNSTDPDHQDFESPESLARTYKDWSATFATMLMDPEGKVGKMFDAKTTPHMFIIDKDSKLVYAGGIDDDPRGSKSDKMNYVDQALSELLGGKAVRISTSRPYGCSVKYSS